MLMGEHVGDRPAAIPRFRSSIASTRSTPRGRGSSPLSFKAPRPRAELRDKISERRAERPAARPLDLLHAVRCNEHVRKPACVARSRSARDDLPQGAQRCAGRMDAASSNGMQGVICAKLCVRRIAQIGDKAAEMRVPVAWNTSSKSPSSRCT